MEKESYSIDDILSEVKKRREENEATLKAADESQFSPPENKEVVFEITEEDPQTEEPEASEQEKAPEEKPEPQPQITAEPEPEEQAKDDVENEISHDDGEEEEPQQEEPEKSEAEEEGAPQEEAENGMVDLLSLAGDDDSLITADNYREEPEKEKFFKTKKGKITLGAIIVLVILVIGAAVFGILYANDALNRITGDNEEYEKVTYYDGMDFLQEDFPAIEELSANEIAGYKEYLKQWYQNGDPVSSTHVLNVLLIGQDTREEEISNASRADSGIIASINIDTQQITLTSVLRDMYVYYEVDGVGTYGKINESAANGGIKTYINTVERYFKVSIDNYVIVNFASFPKIVDAQGGVEIPLTAAEVYEVNNHQARYANTTLPDAVMGEDGEYEKVLLNGKQALAYCRIRYIDSDNARADRQKTVLLELFKKMKGAGTVDTVKVVNSLIDYVSTGYSKKEIISIGNTALKDGWLSFETVTTTVPDMENAKGGQKFAVAPGNWIWKVDFPKDAQELQNKIYGKSNIELNENRADYVNIDY
ncbi:MAG: LCP family protein [Eubacterium sp.]